MSFVVAIDGPAASGKGTLARKLASHYGFHHLDTGLLYRAVASELLAKGLPLDDEAHAVQIAGTLDLDNLHQGRLSMHEIGEAASKVAAMNGVRDALMQAQRTFAKRAPGTVLDGRDIATVICPDAEAKLFITASAEVRADRRFQEGLAKGSDLAFETVLADINKRDERDSSRKVAPLKPAGDAHLIDTSEMDIETAFRQACMYVDSALGGSLKR